MYNWDIPPILSRQFAAQFFTFLVSAEERRSRPSRWQWKTDPKLHHNFTVAQQEDEGIEQRCQAQDSAFLVGRFLQICQDELQVGMLQTLARWHLAAYLEAPCYQAARDRLRAFRNPQDSQQTWEQYLYIGQCITNNPREIDRIYRKYKGQTATLEDHFKLSLASLIQDIFHRQTGQGKYSIWYSLKEASRIKLTEKLKDLGESPSRIDRCLQARQCLLEGYSKSGNRWREPTPEQYQAAAKFCSDRCFPTNPEEFKQLIQTCIRALQAMPKVSYLGEDIETRVCESAATESEPPLQQEIEALNTCLLSGLEALEQEGNNKALFLLRFGLELSGARIGNCLEVNQATVSRHLAQRQRQLLTVALEWLRSRLEIDERAIAQTNQYVALWLQQHYQASLSSILKASWRDRLSPKQQELLAVRYFENIAERQMARQQGRSSGEIREAIAGAKTSLLDDLLAWIEEMLKLKITGEREQKGIAKAIEKWLANEQRNSV